MPPDIYDRQDVIHALHASGLQRGDIAFISTGLGMLGSAVNIDSLSQLNRMIFECIQDVLGSEGSALVPTYSYTFGKSTATEPAVYDPAATPAEIGPFPEFFRQQPGVARSLDPMMSVAGYGPACETLFKDLPPTSYGHGCLFARLSQTDAKICNIGLGPNWTPFIHYADYLAGVPYRFDKLFSGMIMCHGAPQKTTWLYSVPVLVPESEANAHKLGRLAVEAGIWSYVPLGRGRVYTCQYKEYFDFTLKHLGENLWITATGPPSNLIQLEEDRVGQKNLSVQIEESYSLETMMRTLSPLVRDTVSNGFDAALGAIKQIIPMHEHHYASGHNAQEWVVPEKWSCREAYLATESGEVLFSFADHPLHVQSYSLSFNGTVTRKKLFEHLYDEPLHPEAIPHRVSLVERDWALCCSRTFKDTLRDDKYKVLIDTTFSYGKLKLGEVILPGEESGTILVCTYLNGTLDVNAGLSGVVVGLDVARRLLVSSKGKFTIRFLFLPGPVGLAAWLSEHASIIEQLVGGISLQMLGRDLPYCLQLSDPQDPFAFQVRSAIANTTHADPQIIPAPRLFNEFPSGGNPLVTLARDTAPCPWVTLARSLDFDHPCFPYDGFRNSLDCIENIDYEVMQKTSDDLFYLLRSLDETAAPNVLMPRKKILG